MLTKTVQIAHMRHISINLRKEAFQRLFTTQRNLTFNSNNIMIAALNVDLDILEGHVNVSGKTIDRVKVIISKNIMTNAVTSNMIKVLKLI